LLIIIAMLLMLPAGTVLLAGMHGGLSGAGATPGGQITPASLSASSPSKEYVYAGG
jgi:hypothetical protein